MTSPKRPYLAHAILCAAVIAAFSALIWYTVPRFVPTFPASAPTPTPLSATLFSTSALYAPADYTRLMNLGTALQKSQPVTDAELDWAIGLLQRGPVINATATRGSFAIMTLSQLFNHQSLTPKQVHKLAEAVLPFADDPPPAERMPLDGVQAPAVSVQDVAVLTLGSLNDKAAREKLKQLAEFSPTPKIRRAAGGQLTRRRGQGWK